MNAVSRQFSFHFVFGDIFYFSFDANLLLFTRKGKKKSVYPFLHNSNIERMRCVCDENQFGLHVDRLTLAHTMCVISIIYLAQMVRIYF